MGRTLTDTPPDGDRSMSARVLFDVRAQFTYTHLSLDLASRCKA